jgi:Na+-translocating ferredoxin:NAD+ oxidoreductase RnfC subunit
MAECIILDTGALIGIERKNPRVVHALREARRKHYRILIPLSPTQSGSAAQTRALVKLWEKSRNTSVASGKSLGLLAKPSRR